MKTGWHFYAGIGLLITSFVCPFLIPLVMSSHLSVVIKGIVSSMLVFGIPEVLIIVAIALLGKETYKVIENKIKDLLFKGKVSRTRYRIGLFFFSLPLIVGLLEMYIRSIPLWYGEYYYPVELLWTAMFALSFFILGNEFWQKCKGLFLYDSKIVFSKECQD